MNLHEFDISNPMPATLLSSERITPGNSDVEVRHLSLQTPVQEQFRFAEGQNIAVLIPGPAEFGSPLHVRLYSIASSQRGDNGQSNSFSLCVRRCFYIDTISGERYPGRASNFLCDLQPGGSVDIAGPYGSAFRVPEDPEANLLMIGTGTGIAPFRAFVRRIYEDQGGWKGTVRLFYGARTGMELLYRNEFRKDLGLYYNNASFRAFEAISPRPHVDAPTSLDALILENAHEVWQLLQEPKTYVYLAGLVEASNQFEKAMIETAGSEHIWNETKKTLIAEKRYSELVYE